MSENLNWHALDVAVIYYQKAREASQSEAACVKTAIEHYLWSVREQARNERLALEKTERALLELQIQEACARNEVRMANPEERLKMATEHLTRRPFGKHTYSNAAHVAGGGFDLAPSEPGKPFGFVPVTKIVHERVGPCRNLMCSGVVYSLDGDKLCTTCGARG